MTRLVGAMIAALIGCGEEPPRERAPEARPDRGRGELRLTKEQVATGRIATGSVSRRSESASIRATGEIEPPDDGVARVGPKVAGRVSRLLKGVGDRVARGELLAIVDSPDLGRAKADYIAASALAQVTHEAAEREKALFDKKISSEKDLRQAEADATKARAEKDAAEVRLHTLGISDAELARQKPSEHFASSFSVTSPIDGVVVERPITVGQAAQPAETMFVVMDLREVWVLADIYERDLAQIKVGQAVVAHVPAWKDREFPGKVANIGSVIERKSRAVKIRIVMPNSDGALKPGMFATVAIAETSDTPRTGLYVPSGAVQRDGSNNLVFVVKSPGVFAPKRVQIGHEGSDWVEILDGLAESDSVVVAGSFALKSELKKDELGEED